MAPKWLQIDLDNLWGGTSKAVACLMSFAQVTCFILPRYLYSSVSWSQQNFATWSVVKWILKTESKNLRGHSPKKFYGAKTCKIWTDFRRFQTSTANMSRMKKDIIQNWTNIWPTSIPPTFTGRRVKSRELQSTNYRGLEAKSYPANLGGAARPNFYTCYRITKSH